MIKHEIQARLHEYRHDMTLRSTTYAPTVFILRFRVGLWFRALRASGFGFRATSATTVSVLAQSSRGRLGVTGLGLPGGTSDQWTQTPRTVVRFREKVCCRDFAVEVIKVPVIYYMTPRTP